MTTVFSAALMAATINVPDATVYSANTTWSTGNTYVVQGLLTVNATRILTVQTGVIVQFNTGARILVSGTINAAATTTWNSSVGVPDNWYIQVNSGGIVTMNTATISNGDYLLVNAGGSATLTNCTVSYPYFTNNGTLSLIGGSLSCPRPVNIVTHNSGALTLNTVSLDGGSSSPYGVSCGGGSLTLTSASITACAAPIRFSAVTSCTFSGTQTLTGNTDNIALVDITTVAANWTLPALPIPYRTAGPITVNSGTTWTLNVGAVLQVSSNQDLTVSGTLSGSNATFTSTTGSPSNWRIVVNSGGNANLNTCAIEDAEQVVVTAGGTGTFTNCTSDYAYFITSGTFSLSQGTITLPRAGSIVTINAGSTTLNTANLVGAAAGITGVDVLGGSLALQTMNITGTELPIRLAAAGTVTSTGTHTITGNTNPVARIDYTSISSNVSLPSLPLPYYVPGGLTVNSGATLTIATNSIVKFANGTGLTINGRLSAVASVGQKILFTSYQDDNNGGDSNGDGTISAPAVGDWTGLTFNTGGNTASTLTRCEVRYTGYGGQSGGVNVTACAPVLGTCEFYQNVYGIALYDGATPSITSCTMGSSAVTPIAMTLDAQPTFTSNVFSFSNNTYDAIGLFGGTMVVNGNIVQRSVTGFPNVSYVLLSPITIPAGITLNVAAGVVIKAAGGTGFNVQGTLNMNGTSGSRVYFTSVADDAVGQPADTNKDGNGSQPGAWPNIPGPIVLGDPATAGLTYLEMRYATYGYYPSSYAIEDQGATLTMNNCVLRDMANGYVGLDGSNASMTNCQFINISGVPIAIRPSANPTFSGVTFTNVGLTALGIIGGTLSTNGVLAPRNLAGYTNITQVLLSDLTIANGTNVEVQAGVVMKMGYGGSNIFVDGGFKLSGTALNPVVLTSWYDDTRGNPGDTNQDLGGTVPNVSNWGGIYYQATANDAYNTVNYAVLRYGGYICPYISCYDDRSTDRGVLHYLSAGGTVTNTTMQFNAYGCTFSGSSNPSVSSSTIDGCTMEPFGQSFEATPVFTNVTFGINNARNGIRLLTRNQYSDATLQPGVVNGFGPVSYITNNLTVHANATLIISPGTIIKLDGSLGILGGLVAVGTSVNPIYFTSFSDDAVGGDANNNGNSTVPQAGNWGRIYFDQGSLSGMNHLRYCKLLYGGGSTEPIGFNSCGGTVEDCQIEFAPGYVVGVFGSANPLFQNNTINLANAPVYMSAFANPTFTNNQWNNVNYMMLALVPENISVSGTLPLREFNGFNPIVYHLPGTMTILNGVTLTIQPGTVFKTTTTWCPGWCSYPAFNVQGKLIVNGTPSNPVVFTELRDDEYGLPSDCNLDGNSSTPTLAASNHITFDGISDDASVIQNALFRYRDQGVVTTSSRPHIRNCTFDQCNWGSVSYGLESPWLPYNTYNNVYGAPALTSILCVPDSLIGLTFTGATKKMHGILNETLVQNITLQKKDLGSIVSAPYYFYNGFAVGTNATLSVAPGVVCKFGSGTGLSVSRALQALGTAGPNTTIVFTHEGDDFYGGDSNGDGNTAPGTWAGISFENASVDADCDIVRSVIRYAGNAITCNSASPVISNTLMQNCTNGVVANVLSNPVLSNNDFQSISGFAVNNVSGAYTINAENCWWGSNTGPTHSGNPSGIGAVVTDLVDYNPFRTTGPQAPLMGDVSLNGVVQAFDASQVLQYTASLLTLNALQLQVGDVTGNGTVTALDASHILQHVVGLRPTFDAELGMPQQVTPILSQQVVPVGVVVADASATAGETFTVEVDLSGVSELYSLQLTLDFDAQHLTLVNVESLLPETFSALSNETMPGNLLFSAASAYAMTADGPALRLTFTAATGLATELISYVEPTAVTIDEVDMTPYAMHGIVTLAPDLSTGALEELVATGGVVLYPNPAVDGFTIAWNGLDTSVPVEIGIFDPTGRLVFTTRMSVTGSTGGNSIYVDRSALTGAVNLSGPLFVRVAQGDAVVWGRVVLN